MLEVLCLVPLLLCGIQSVLSSLAIISLRKRELVALLNCLLRCPVAVSVLLLFLMVPWVVLQCVIVAFSGQKHLLLEPLKLKLTSYIL